MKEISMYGFLVRAFILITIALVSISVLGFATYMHEKRLDKIEFKMEEGK